MTISAKNLEHWFTYHPPNVEKGDIEAYQRIRDAGFNLAYTIISNTPPCADQTAAIRKIREAVMTANAARACDGK
jgi:hypothetical protein